MLAQYACFARRVNMDSEKSHEVGTRLLLCMGLFCGFCFGAVIAPTGMIGAAALTRIPFPGMIARFRHSTRIFPTC